MKSASPQLRDAISYYHELLTSRHLASTRDTFVRATEEKQLCWLGRPICSILRPHFIDSRSYAELRRTALIVTRALARLTEQLLSERALARQAGIPEYVHPLLDIDRAHGEFTPMARLDGLLDEDGVVKFIEFNADPFGSMWASDGVDRVFESLPIAADFKRRFPFRSISLATNTEAALLAAHRARGGSGPPCILVIGPTHRPSSTAFWLRGLAPSVPVRVGPAEDLELRGDRLYLGAERIDLVSIDVPSLTGPRAPRVLMQAFATGAAQPVWGVSRNIMSSFKILFELLSDPAWAHLFDAETLAVLSRHIPWTRRVRACNTTYREKPVDLLPFVAQYRERLVLKPSGDLGGGGVVLGWEADTTRWEAALRAATRRPYVVQERVVDEAAPYPVLVDGRVEIADRLVDLDPFVWNLSRAEGYFVRVVPSGVRNITTGGSMTPRWILDPPG